MIPILSAVPILITILALGCGIRSLTAALLGVASTVLAISLAFPIPLDHVAPAALQWSPILMEVLLIVAGGLLLAEVLRHAGGQAALAAWIGKLAGRGVGGVLLVVHGITPFAESVTGFGIGVTIGIPLLVHFGLAARKVALIGLLGLCAVPWGSMGPGTLIASTMSGLPLKDLGVASGVLSVFPFVVTGIAAAGLASPPDRRRWAIVQGLLSGLVLTLCVTGINAVFGTAPAGALGALGVIGLHLLWAKRQGKKAELGLLGRRALASYGVLLGGVLTTGWGLHVADLPEAWRYIASPALWLFVAALWFARGLPEAVPMRRAWGAWRQVGPVTGMFLLLGVLMTVSGMAVFLAQSLAAMGHVYLAVAPFVGALGGFVTGSNSGANAMFAATQSEIARSLGVDVLWFMASHNVAAAFLLLASPGKIEMALQLAPAEAAQHRRWLQRMTLGIAVVVVSPLAIVNVICLSG